MGKKKYKKLKKEIYNLLYDDTPVRYSDDTTYQTFGCWVPKGTLNFTVVGDTIVEDTEITGSEY